MVSALWEIVRPETSESRFRFSKSVPTIPGSLPLFALWPPAPFGSTPTLRGSYPTLRLQHQPTPGLCLLYLTGPHSFDLDDDSEASREIIRQTLAFLQRNLPEQSSKRAFSGENPALSHAEFQGWRNGPRRGGTRRLHSCLRRSGFHAVCDRHTFSRRRAAHRRICCR
jgi:hypothetical protein